MTAPFPYTMTYDSITVVLDGETHVVQRGTPNFFSLQRAIIEERWGEVPKHVNVAISLENWTQGKFSVDGDIVYYDGDPVPESLNNRIINMASKGESPAVLFNFWERLQRNPSFRSVQQLWPFLQHEGIPLTEDGCFLAYKSVRSDYKDHHTGSIDNSPGTTHEMPRNKISDDPRKSCHYGFHVGARSYAEYFGDIDKHIVICKVDPEHVVCVPYDNSMQKMRVCKYEVIGLQGGDLPSTTFDTRTEQEAFMDNVIPLTDWDESDDDEEEEDFGLANSIMDEVRESEPEDEDRENFEDEEDFEDDDEGDEDEEGEKEKNIADMDIQELFKVSLSDLRSYAAHELKIIGASKIPGGKSALIMKIVELRQTNK